MPYHMGVNTVESVIKKGRLVFDQRQGGVIHAG
jgi:imidazolonepropionase-like amidohydrolase